MRQKVRIITASTSMILVTGSMLVPTAAWAAPERTDLASEAPSSEGVRALVELSTPMTLRDGSGAGAGDT